MKFSIYLNRRVFVMDRYKPPFSFHHSALICFTRFYFCDVSLTELMSLYANWITICIFYKIWDKKIGIVLFKTVISQELWQRRINSHRPGIVMTFDGDQLNQPTASAHADHRLHCPSENILNPLLSTERPAKSLIRYRGIAGWTLVHWGHM